MPASWKSLTLEPSSGTLLNPLYCLLLVIQPLAASQIDEGELIDDLDLRAVLLTDLDLEYGVTPGRLLDLDRREHLPRRLSQGSHSGPQCTLHASDSL